MSSRRGLPTAIKMRHEAHYVEELWQRNGAPIGRMIPIDRLEPNPLQPRIEIGDLTDLIASISERGVLEPLLVRPSSVGGRFMIISGERRYRASLAAGLTDLPCIEMEVDDRAVAEIALIENLQRKDLTPFEEAEGLLALVERFRYTHEEVAKKIGKSRSTITEVLSISSLSKEIKELCCKSNITSKSMLLQIVRQPDDETRASLIKKIKNQGLTRDDVRQANRVGQQGRPRPFIFKFKSPEQDFVLDIRFRRSTVDNTEVLAALRKIIVELEQNS